MPVKALFSCPIHRPVFYAFLFQRLLISSNVFPLVSGTNRHTNSPLVRILNMGTNEALLDFIQDFVAFGLSVEDESYFLSLSYS